MNSGYKNNPTTPRFAQVVTYLEVLPWGSSRLSVHIPSALPLATISRDIGKKHLSLPLDHHLGLFLSTQVIEYLFIEKHPIAF